LERAKRKVYNEVLHHENQNDITQSIANNLMYYERRVHTKELAERVACTTAKDLNKIAEKVYKGMQNAHVTLWGKLPMLRTR
jgi:predicted Zn-dependent peptidase